MWGTGQLKMGRSKIAAVSVAVPSSCREPSSSSIRHISLEGTSKGTNHWVFLLSLATKSDAHAGPSALYTGDSHATQGNAGERRRLETSLGCALISSGSVAEYLRHKEQRHSKTAQWLQHE